MLLRVRERVLVPRLGSRKKVEWVSGGWRNERTSSYIHTQRRTLIGGPAVFQKTG